MVGIAFTGVPIFDGSSENNVDALFPNPNIPANNYLHTMDACLGNVDHQNPFYHYYTYSPCMMNTTTQWVATNMTQCSGFGNCYTSVLNYMVAGATKNLTMVGVARDGHIIYGPYNSQGNLW